MNTQAEPIEMKKWFREGQVRQVKYGVLVGEIVFGATFSQSRGIVFTDEPIWTEGD